MGVVTECQNMERKYTLGIGMLSIYSILYIRSKGSCGRGEEWEGGGWTVRMHTGIRGAARNVLTDYVYHTNTNE